jgi:hypothetical protein
VVTLSSSDTKEALTFLSLSLVCNLSSHLSKGNTQDPSSISGTNLFEDWPNTNDMVASVYVVLTTEGSSSRASPTEATRCRQKSHVDSFVI